MKGVLYIYKKKYAINIDNINLKKYIDDLLVENEKFCINEGLKVITSDYTDKDLMSYNLRTKNLTFILSIKFKDLKDKNTETNKKKVDKKKVEIGTNNQYSFSYVMTQKLKKVFDQYTDTTTTIYRTNKRHFYCTLNCPIVEIILDDKCKKDTDLLKSIIYMTIGKEIEENE